METLQPAGIELIIWLQRFSPTMNGVMDFFSFLGRIEFYLLLLPFIYWNLNPSRGFRLLMLLITTDVVGSSFKQLLRQPRPYWVSEDVKGIAEEASYGIPSTHASGSIAVWGYLAYHVKNWWMWLLSGTVIFFVALSRLYLGVHFPHDILGGWLIGLVTLILFITFEDRVASWATAKSPGFQIGIGFGLSLLIILVGTVVTVVSSAIPDPPSWAPYSVDAHDLSQYFTVAGAMFGAVLGYVLMKRYALFDAEGSWVSWILRYVAGIFGVILVWMGLDIIFSAIAPDNSTLGFILRYLRYTATTLWAFLGAPWLFLRLRLAEKPKTISGATQ